MSLVLSNTTKGLLRKSATVRGLLADLFKKHPASISRWIEEDNPSLTAYAAIQIYKEHFKLAEADLLQNQPLEA